MGDFVAEVQQGRIPGPTSRKFTLEKWKSSFSQHNTDDIDENLYLVGIEIFNKFTNLRAALVYPFSDEVDASTKLRAFIALANYESCRLRSTLRNHFDQSVPNSNLTLAHELMDFKFKLDDGGEYSPDEMIQSQVDALQVPIKIILNSNKNRNSQPKFSLINWDILNRDIGISVNYISIESLWDDCLWNNSQLSIVDDSRIFTPSDHPLIKHFYASERRLDHIDQIFFSHAHRIFNKKEYNQFLGIFKRLQVHDVVKEGKKQKIILAKNQPVNSTSKLIAVSINHAMEPYYGDLINESNPMIAGASLMHVIMSWGIISNITRFITENLISTNEFDDIYLRNNIEKFCPSLKISAIASAIVNSLGVSLQQAHAILDFLIYSGKPEQELWTQPLIPLNSSSVSPIISAALSPNLSRMIDVWLQQLNVDLAKRGPLFENFVNHDIQSLITNSSHLQNAKSLPNGMTFSPKNDRKEQIDTVLIIGDLVILAELKCIKRPTDRKQNFYHRQTIINAVSQIKRKSESALRNADEFRKQLSELGVNLVDNFRILPAIIINSPIHSGISYKDVPIIDQHILNVFFSGELINAAIEEKGKLTTVNKTILYSNFDDAIDIAISYLKSPPQMKVFTDGIFIRNIPILEINPNDWKGKNSIYGCELNAGNLFN